MDAEIRLKQARISHEAAINALPYIPQAARPYTLQTIDKYVDEILMLEREIEAARGRIK